MTALRALAQRFAALDDDALAQADLEALYSNGAPLKPGARQAQKLLAGVFQRAGRTGDALEVLRYPAIARARDFEAADTLILDPGFVHMDGHHANTNQYYLELAGRLGRDARVLRNARPHESFAGDRTGSLPLFSLSPYEVLFPSPPTARHIEACNALFGAEFEATLAGARPGVVIAHTVRHSFVNGLAGFIACHWSARPLRLVMGVVETDVLDAGHALHGAVAHTYRSAFERLRACAGLRVLLVAETPALAEFLAQHCDGAYPVVRSDYVGARLGGLQAVNPEAPPETPTIGFVGQSRPERGVARVPEIAERVLAQSNHPVRWALQMDVDRVARLGGESAAAALGRLRAHPGVRFADPNLPVDAYHALVNSVDILVLPYSERYRASGSGIALEGIRRGAVQVVPAGSSMQKAIEAGGGRAVCFERADADSVTAAVLSAVDAFPALWRANRPHGGGDGDPLAQRVTTFIGNDSEAAG